MKLLAIILLMSATANAATIKQLLNDQNLAVLEANKTEVVTAGDSYIATNGKTQCLIEVISVKEKLATASTKSCNDKGVLAVGKKVEKSLIDPQVLNQNAPPAVETVKTEDTNAPVPQATAEALHERSPATALVPHDLNFRPKQLQFAGATKYSSEYAKIENETTSTYVETRASILSQDLGIGITNNIAASVTLRNVTSGDVNTGSNSPIYNVSIHSDPLASEDFVSLGITIAPKGSTTQALSSDYLGLSISAGKVYSDSSATVFAKSIAYAETASIEKRSSLLLGVGYQSNFSTNAFMQLSLGLQANSNEVSKTTNLTVEYTVIPLLGIGFGFMNYRKNVSGMISLEAFSTKVAAKTTSTTHLIYSGSSLAFSVAYAF